MKSSSMHQSEHPGFVFYRNTLKGDEVKKQLNKVSLDEFSASILPQVLKPPGLTRERQKYLYGSIRPHVAPEFQDKLFGPPYV